MLAGISCTCFVVHFICFKKSVDALNGEGEVGIKDSCLNHEFKVLTAQAQIINTHAQIIRRISNSETIAISEDLSS